VGDATTNGTAGAITTGNAFPIQTISPNQEFLNTHTQERIQIISVPGQTVAPPPPPLLGSNRPDSNTIPQDILANLVGDIVGAKTTINPDAVGNSRYGWTLAEGSLNTDYINLQNLLAQGNLNQAITQIDEVFEEEFENYLGENFPHETVTVEGIRTVLKTIKSETKTQPAIVYALSTPQQLELVLVMPDGSPIRKVVPEANAAALQKTLTEFRKAVTNVTDSRGYLAPAQQLYQWMIAPLESELEALGIDTLIFCMDAGLRLVPMAALHDGKQFLVEKYSLGSIPSVSLTNSRYKAVKDAQVLGMGASEFQQLAPLPAVPTELNVITQQLWTGKSFLNEEFTEKNLLAQRQPFGIIHLATHADFQPGKADNAYIQLWDSQLKVNQLRQMGWHQPPQVELLVLSACRTALGDVDAELGFAGLAVQAGVKSALASLWYVSDEGTLAIMGGFYQHLRQPDVTIKAEALRRAQLAMLQKQVRVENGKLQGLDELGSIPLPPELAAQSSHDFSHPYYWAAFTMIGSPW
jgi:CHAT domain-containing protein